MVTPFNEQDQVDYNAALPGIIRWPGVIPAGLVSDEPCLTFDFTASMVRLAGVKPTADKPLDGVDIIEHIVKRHEPLSRMLFWRKQRGTTIWKAVREGSMKYVAQAMPERSHEYLFDLNADPTEQIDLRIWEPTKFSRLKAAYAQWEDTVRRNRRGQPSPE
jgi:arylsulfatase A-like enzyme